MKSIVLSLLSVLFIFSSCQFADDCASATLNTNIIGKWILTVDGIVYGEVEFFPDGTLDDPDHILIEGESVGEILDIQTYEVISETEFWAWATNAADNTHIYGDYYIKSMTCDEIILDNFIVEASLSRLF